MRRDDPLDNWLFYLDLERESPAANPRRERELQVEVQRGLDQLDALLDAPGPKGVKFSNSYLSAYAYGMGLVVALSEQEIARIQALYPRVRAASGNGKAGVEEGLLHLLGRTAHPSSLPLWRELLDISERGAFSATRRRLALASIALTAIKQDHAEALQLLEACCRYERVDVRALALRYLGLVYFQCDDPLPEHVRDLLATVATQDPAFEPRFQARVLLRAEGLPVPFDNPEGAYSFKVWLKGLKRVHRTIAIRSDQSLLDLHYAIQRAFQWDSDHLFSFFLSGDRYAESYRVDSRNGSDEWGSELIVLREIFGPPPAAGEELANPGDTKEDDELSSAEEDDDEPPSLASLQTPLGELGLPLKHRFSYLFDYGDNHLFELELIEVQPKRDRKKHPRVLDSAGKSPPQYRYERYNQEPWDE